MHSVNFLKVNWEEKIKESASIVFDLSKKFRNDFLRLFDFFEVSQLQEIFDKLRGLSFEDLSTVNEAPLFSISIENETVSQFSSLLIDIKEKFRIKARKQNHTPESAVATQQSIFVTPFGDIVTGPSHDAILRELGYCGGNIKHDLGKGWVVINGAIKESHFKVSWGDTSSYDIFISDRVTDTAYEIASEIFELNGHTTSLKCLRRGKNKGCG